MISNATNGELRVTGNFNPSADDTYDLGSDTLRWRDLYLGPNSLNIGITGNNGVLSYDTANSRFNFNRDIYTFGNGLEVLADNGDSLNLLKNSTEGYFGFYFNSGDVTFDGMDQKQLYLTSNLSTFNRNSSLLEVYQYNDVYTSTAPLVTFNNTDTNTAQPVLQVSNAGTGTLITADTTNASANGVSIDVQSSSSAQYVLNVTSNNGATQGLYVRADGNVGIGTTNPGFLLTVAGVIQAGNLSGDALRVGDDSKLVDINVANTLAVYGVQDNTTATLQLGSNTGSRITGYNGNIGIGFTGPTYKLAVNGSGRYAGDLAVGVDTALPVLEVDSSSSGGDWTSQGARISWGESASGGGSAAGHLTYTGDGYAYIGSGAVTAAGLPGASYLRFDYNSNNIYTPDALSADRLLAAAGVNTAPSFAFSNDTNTGIHNTGTTDILFIAVNGSDKFRFRTDYNTSLQALYVNTDMYVENGTNYTRVHNNGSGGYIDTQSGGLYLRPANSNIYTGAGDNLSIYGQGYKPGGGSWASNSDRRLKKNIQNYSYGLDAIRNINPVTFQYNSLAEEGLRDGKTYTGVIAQDILPVLPGTVTVDDRGYYRYDSTEVTYALINATKELDLQVQSNTSRIANLEASTTSLTKANLTVTNTTTTGKLTVTSSATIANLKVTGLTELADLKVDRIITKGSAPTAVLGATTTGQGSTYIIAGNDTAGSISFVTGTDTITNPLAAGEQVVVTFTDEYADTPRITLTPTSEAAASSKYYVVKDTNSFQIFFIDPPQANETYSFDYQILQ